MESKSSSFNINMGDSPQDQGGGPVKPQIPEFNTLDEPITDTIMRDVKAVTVKLKYVLYPRNEKSQTLLKEWDLWGPFIICFLLSILLQGSKQDPEFAEMFSLLWFGSVVVALNSKLLGGHLSIFQSVCVLGYCMLPPLFSLLACNLFLMFSYYWDNVTFMLRLLATTAGFIWATYASTVFLGDSQPKGKKGLALYPIFLFYFFISWVILSHNI